MKVKLAHYLYEIEMVDKDDRILKEFAEADTATEAVRMVKDIHGNGWTVRNMRIILAK